MFGFIRFVLGMAWKYGKAAVAAAAKWAAANWKTVAKWIAQGGAGWALEMILRHLGYL